MKFSVNDYNTGTENEHRKDSSIPISAIGEVSKLLFEKMKRTNSGKYDKPKSIKLILHSLYINDGVTQLDIVKYTGLKPPTVSITLQKMESEGLVSRSPDPYDLRAVRVHMTDKGREVFLSSINSICEMEKAIVSNISEEEIELFMSVLNKIKDNLNNI